MSAKCSDSVYACPRKMHYPPETACIMLVARMLATVRQAEDKEGAINLFMQVTRTLPAHHTHHKLIQ